MAERITCQHDPLKPGCSLVIESGIMGRRVRCQACDIAAVARADGTFKCSPFEPRAAEGKHALRVPELGEGVGYAVIPGTPIEKPVPNCPQPPRALPVEAEAVLINAAQLIDGIKNTAPQDWTEWDQQVRDSISALLSTKPTQADMGLVVGALTKSAATHGTCRANSDGVCDWIACPRASSNRTCPRAADEKPVPTCRTPAEIGADLSPERRAMVDEAAKRVQADFGPENEPGVPTLTR